MQRRIVWIVLALGCEGAVMNDAGSSSDAAMVETDGGADAGAIDAGADGGSDEGPRVRWPLQTWPVDLTPDGSWAALQDPLTPEGDLFLMEVATGEIERVTSVGSSELAFATAISATRSVTALHANPVNAGVFNEDGGWVDLDIPFDTHCEPHVGGAWDVSADGTIVVGMGWDGCNARAMRWDGQTPEPLAMLGTNARATAISDDGRVVGGWAQTEMVDRWPTIWREDGTGVLLPGDTPDAPGEILSVSADGSVVAGIWNLQGFRYSEADGVETLGLLPGGLGGDSTYPNAIAAGGALIFGGSGSFGATEAFVWTETEGMRRLSELAVAAGVTIPSGYVLTNVIAASTDGSVVLGTAATLTGSPMSFVLELPTSAYGI
jgi:hypothetical protein